VTNGVYVFPAGKKLKKANVAPKIDLNATHQLALEYVSLELLQQYSI
jgi:uncharacterized protein (DUF2237 family)